MADVYQDVSEEEMRQVVNGLSRKLGHGVLELVENAAAVGWKVVVTGPDSVSLIAPGDPPPKRLHFSTKNKGKAPVHKMMSQIMRYADQEKVRAIKTAAKDPNLSMEDFGVVVDAMASEATVEFMLPDKVKEEPKVVTPKVMPPKKTELKVARTIISQQPVLMHHSLNGPNGGQSYPSQTTLERRWSDGTIDYKCAVKGCEKTSDNRLAFRSAHYAMHVRNGEAEPFDKAATRTQLVDDPNYVAPAYDRKDAKPRDSRIGVLAGFLATLDLGLTTTELAERILTFLSSRSEGSQEVTSAPLTDEQVLDRIRRLVDRGAYAKQQEQIDTLSLTMSGLTDNLLLAEQRATKAESTLIAFKELFDQAV